MSFLVSPSMRNVMMNYPIDADSGMPELPRGYWWALGNCEVLDTKQLELRRSYSVTKRRLFRGPVTRHYYKVVESWPADNPNAYLTPEENLRHFAYMILTYRPGAMYIKFDGALNARTNEEI